MAANDAGGICLLNFANTRCFSETFGETSPHA